MVLVWAGYVHPAAQQKDLAQAALTNSWMQEQALPWRVHAESATTIQV
jgi:hypothetical protein